MFTRTLTGKGGRTWSCRPLFHLHSHRGGCGGPQGSMQETKQALVEGAFSTPDGVRKERSLGGRTDPDQSKAHGWRVPAYIHSLALLHLLYPFSQRETEAGGAPVVLLKHAPPKWVEIQCQHVASLPRNGVEEVPEILGK